MLFRSGARDSAQHSATNTATTDPHMWHGASASARNTATATPNTEPEPVQDVLGAPRPVWGPNEERAVSRGESRDGAGIRSAQSLGRSLNRRVARVQEQGRHGKVSLTGELDPVAVDDNKWLGRRKGARS